MKDERGEFESQETSAWCLGNVVLTGGDGRVEGGRGEDQGLSREPARVCGRRQGTSPRAVVERLEMAWQVGEGPGSIGELMERERSEGRLGLLLRALKIGKRRTMAINTLRLQNWRKPAGCSSKAGLPGVRGPISSSD